MNHTCDTARSGSERSENTCAACHEELCRSLVSRGYGDLLVEWGRYTTPTGRTGKYAHLLGTKEKA